MTEEVPEPLAPSKAAGSHGATELGRSENPNGNVELPATVRVKPRTAPDGAANAAADRASQTVPTQIGRYRVIRELGHGGFGTVYLGHDDLTDRPVAIKVPRPDRLGSDQAVDAFLSEARHVARLDHPGIVTLYDCGQAEDGCYLVYKYIEGTNLTHRMRQGPMLHSEAALLVAQIADALHDAHCQNVFHRDIKPGNILLDRHGQPHVTDFGLAVREDELSGERGRRSGTCPYISPEQVRGEGHHIDGRTDIYSLGVVLYELLSGRPPFDRHSGDVLEQIQFRNPRPPRQINDSIPRELERICLKALSKQMNGRYETAKDMADDLRAAVAPPAAGAHSDAAVGPPVGQSQLSNRKSATANFKAQISPPPRVVPKGLRSFGPEDSDFFLELLPGPCDRDGVPDSIRFWKARIESRDADDTFAVGLIYGPSGCGKSSLVKAGLLPRLGTSVRKVYVEATREDTEVRLAWALRKACPPLEDAASLADIFTRLRRGGVLAPGEKLLVVIDQFEQWLHTHGHEMETTGLFAALRHADGARVQVILMVRDDFWRGITRLFDKLEIALDGERNARLVDLFDQQHAQRVLLLLGQAYGRLPPHEDDLTREQSNFLDQAVNELSEQGRVISVRLSLFAELMKARPWTLATLVEVGGTAGVGVRFLEETFTSRSALPDHRAIEKPARALLQALLPEPGTDIKGHMRSRPELAAACGLPENSHRFHRLIDILDRELHVITPTETESSAEDQELRAGGAPLADASARDSRPSLLDASALTLNAQPSTLNSFYQLTHDYLVPPLRQWLTLERRKTWPGRAELCLEERTAQMSRWPQSRYLPSLLEYLSIVLAVPRSRRRPEQRALMRQATRHHGSRWGAALLAWLIVAVSVELYISSVRSSTQQQRAAALVEALLSAPAQAVPYAVQNLNDLEHVALPLLRERLRDESLDFPLRLHAALALARFGEVDAAFLVNSIAAASPEECENILAAMERAKEWLKPDLSRRFHAEQKPAVRARYAASLLHVGDPQAARLVLTLAPDPSHRTAYVHGFDAWHGDLAPLAQLLRQGQDGAFRSGHCAALGLIRPDSLAAHDRDALQDALLDSYGDAQADGATHSAAGWALRQWGAELPDLPRSPPAPHGQQWFVNSFGMTLLRIEPGDFTMGEPGAEDAESRQHKVTISTGFYMCDREVTVALFRLFVSDPDYADTDKPQSWPGPSAASPTDDCPVQQVDWYDAVLFCNWLSRKERRTPCYRRAGDRQKDWACDWEADGYRLPTEAEWEYACRAGTTTLYNFGDDLGLLPHYAVVNAIQAAPGASRLPNAWGLFDMHGNVFEWCWDRSGNYPDQHVTDPRGGHTGTDRVLRGGPWTVQVGLCRSDNRTYAQPTSRTGIFGFRIVCADKTRPDSVLINSDE